MIALIHLQNVSKIYKAKHGDVNAVQDVTLDIKKGEIFGIIGYSGAGKSSLIRLLNGLEKPTSGTVEVAGTELNKVSSRGLRKARQEISMIFQHFNLCGRAPSGRTLCSRWKSLSVKKANGSAALMN